MTWLFEEEIDMRSKSKDLYIALRDWRDEKEIDFSFVFNYEVFINHRDRAIAVHYLFELLVQFLHLEDE